MNRTTRILFTKPPAKGGLMRSWLWVFMLMSLPALSWGQQITRLEYFFNVDPGSGNGTILTVVPTTNLDNFNFSASISSLSDGFHTLYIRAGDDSSQWSHTKPWPFYKLTVPPSTAGIHQIEYFFNNDPGFGLGTIISLSPTQVLDPYSMAIDISGLPEGFNHLFVRVRNQDGAWSFPTIRSFFKAALAPPATQLAALEYFLNTDPGPGLGTPVPLTANAAVDSATILVDITSLSEGFHNLFIRAQDILGRWSHAKQVNFFKFNLPVAAGNIVDAEYFINTDPGPGNGTKITFTPDTNLSNLMFNIDISQLNQGFHKLGVRVKDVSGRWSHTTVNAFFRVIIPSTPSDIVEMEYFFNMDPGFGMGTPISMVAGTDLTFNLSVDISQLSNGFNYLFIRGKNATGKWSQSIMRSFFKESVVISELPIVYAEYFLNTDPGLNQGTPIPIQVDTSDISLAFSLDIGTLPEGFHRLFVRVRDAYGKWSLTHFRPFFRQVFHDTLGKITAVEYFFDTDPGIGNGIAVPVTPQANIPFLAWKLDLSGIAFGQHNLFVRTKDEHGKWSLTNRTEIFYYLDSLPTASLSGPVGFCIHDTGYFEVTLTGTGPWTLVFDNGFTIDTISNIVNFLHYIPVVPDSAGNFTARVLSVQDIYYTGLYTGIPIDYQVYPLPVLAGPISGPHNVCEGSTSVGYSVYYIGNATSYHWSVPPGAVIISSGYYWNYHYIYVDFPLGAQSGDITARGINHCGQGPVATLPITLRPNPSVDAGLDEFLPWGDSAVLFATPTGGTPPYSYYWSPWWVFQNYTLQSPTAWPGSTMGVSVTLTDTFGCSATDGLTLYVGNPNGTTFSGVVRYDNQAGSPLAFANVMMKQANDIIFDTLAAADGSFQFAEVPAGYYHLTASSDKPWEAVNATDALLIAKHFVDSISLAGLKRIAADVNASGFINATDALLCTKRFVGLIDAFPSGDWYFESVHVYSYPSGFQQHDVRGILFGDVDASYTPLKQGPKVSLLTEGELLVPAEGSVDLPLRAAEDMELAAISLVLNIPQGIQVQAVSLPEGWIGELLFNQIGQELRISWFSLQAMNVKAGDPILILTTRHAFLPRMPWTLGNASSMANGQGISYPMAKVTLPALVKGTHGFELGQNHPNPFSLSTIIPYALPAEANVRVSILNLLGEEVMVLLDERQAAGQQQLELDAARLAPGIYHYRLLAKTAGQRFEQTRKLIVIR